MWDCIFKAADWDVFPLTSTQYFDSFEIPAFNNSYHLPSHRCKEKETGFVNVY